MRGPSLADAKAHRHRLVLSGHLELHSHRAEPAVLRAFNNRAASIISAALSSMYAFWFCVALDLVELPSVIRAGDPVIWVTYIAQTVIQLLALPALGAYAKLNQQMQDEQAKAQAETLTAIHGLVADVHTINQGQDRKLDQLLAIHGGPPKAVTIEPRFPAGP